MTAYCNQDCPVCNAEHECDQLAPTLRASWKREPAEGPPLAIPFTVYSDWQMAGGALGLLAVCGVCLLCWIL